MSDVEKEELLKHREALAALSGALGNEGVLSWEKVAEKVSRLDSIAAAALAFRHANRAFLRSLRTGDATGPLVDAQNSAVSKLFTLLGPEPGEQT